jgi:NitT/TauT family transport system permease protein
VNATAPTKAARATPDTEGSWWVDLLALSFVFAVIATGTWFGQRSTSAFRQAVEIDLSWTALPAYALLSFTRGVIAYLISLAFTLVYGTIAAKSRRAERVLIPLLDVLQGIPVLGFLPPLTIGMIALFPRSSLGLEIACVVMIFTSQAWNMTFSFYGSLRGIPTELVEVAQVYRSSWWRRFTRLELPASAIGLIWNSMVSMAGGWFFLMTCEAFRLQDSDYRLPGLGSYMTVAYEKDDKGAIAGAILAMIAVIVLSDQLIWRPLVVWSQRFRNEEVEASEAPRSFVYDLLSRSRLARRLAARKKLVAQTRAPTPVPRIARPEGRWRGQAVAVLGWTVAVTISALSLYGAGKLVALLGQLPASRWGEIAGSLGLTTLRTIAALAIATLWTVPVGVAIGSSPRIARRALAIVQVLASFPAPMLFPLIAIPLVDRLGIPFGWASVALTLFGAQWYVLFNVIAGAMSIPTDLREVALVFHTKGARRWRRLILPGIFPSLLTGLITAAGGAWNAAMVTEYQHMGDRQLVARGLGSLISQAADASDYALLAAAIAALTLTLVLLNRFVWKRLYRFSDERFSLNK